MTAAEKKARQQIAGLTTEQVIEQFELTEKIAFTVEVATVRGWLMDALATRNPEAFENWIEYGYEDSPREYFI